MSAAQDREGRGGAVFGRPGRSYSRAPDSGASEQPAVSQEIRLNGTRQGQRVLKQARGLGWFSIGLGLAELLAPQAMARATGLQGREALLRLYGLREIATGVGLLVTARPSAWLWGRVGGDVVDLATLGTALHPDNPQRLRAAVALAAVATVGVADVVTVRAVLQADAAAGPPAHDYSDRRGLAEVPDRMRGAAASDFEVPEDMRTPKALRPYSLH